MTRRNWLCALLFGLMGASPGAYANVPLEYGAIVIKTPLSFSEHVFDLTPAVARARAENKPLFIYYSAPANQCPPCLVFERFLADNKEALVPEFRGVVLADVRGWLRPPKLIYVIDGQRYTFRQLNDRFGDARRQLWFPYIWYVTPTLQQIQQLGDGSGGTPTEAFTNVEQLKAILRSGLARQ